MLVRGLRSWLVIGRNIVEPARPPVTCIAWGPFPSFSLTVVGAVRHQKRLAREVGSSTHHVRVLQKQRTR